VEWIDGIPVPVPFDKASFFMVRHNSIQPLCNGISQGFEEAGGVILQNCKVNDIQTAKPLQRTQQWVMWWHNA
jgi:phytoene dehydrogenase-like protein